MSQAKLKKAVSQAAEETRSNMRHVKPHPLTWCIRHALYTLYNHRPYY